MISERRRGGEEEGRRWGEHITAKPSLTGY
jgi:hypothetical protein